MPKILCHIYHFCSEHHCFTWMEKNNKCWDFYNLTILSIFDNLLVNLALNIVKFCGLNKVKKWMHCTHKNEKHKVLWRFLCTAVYTWPQIRNVAELCTLSCRKHEWSLPLSAWVCPRQVYNSPGDVVWHCTPKGNARLKF